LKFLAHGGGGIEANDEGPTIASIDREQRLTYTYPHPTNWGAFEVVSPGTVQNQHNAYTFTAIA
jgi:hypothetical protein